MDNTADQRVVEQLLHLLNFFKPYARTNTPFAVQYRCKLAMMLCGIDKSKTLDRYLEFLHALLYLQLNLENKKSALSIYVNRQWLGDPVHANLEDFWHNHK